MWSLGCVIAEMHTGYPLFPGESEDEQLMMYIELLGNPPHSLLEQGSRRKRFFNDNFECRIIQSSDKYRMPKGLTFEKALENCQNKLFV
jgi:dual specificity tyrosine-phosphorylation-regulated kinase 2/3/4